jgi:hypothetical protein
MIGLTALERSNANVVRQAPACPHVLPIASPFALYACVLKKSFINLFFLFNGLRRTAGEDAASSG